MIQSTDARLVKLCTRLAVPQKRRQERLVLVEGTKAVADALAAGAGFEAAIASTEYGRGPAEAALLERLRAVRAIDFHEASPRILERVSTTETPQGIVAVAHEPVASLRDLLARRAPSGPLRLAILDGVQDPGNVGACLRVAAAFGFDGALAGPGTADPFGPKVVRAAAATVFRLPIAPGPPLPELAAGLRAASVRVVALAAGGAAPESARAGARFALLAGNEGAGIPEGHLGLCDARVWVPITPGVESLNVAVAFGVAAYLLARTGPRA